MTKDELAAWIEELRGKLERGDLAGHPPIYLEALRCVMDDVEQSVANILEEVEACRALPPAVRIESWQIVQRRWLARRLILLRDRLSEVERSPEELNRQRRV